jgi:hypothetical protein
MTVSLAAAGVLAGVTVAASDLARRRSERLRSPESWREVTMRALMGVHVHATPMTMGSSVSGGAIHAAKLLVR